VNTVADRQQLIQSNFNRQDITLSLLKQQQQQLIQNQTQNTKEAQPPSQSAVLQHSQLQAQVSGTLPNLETPKVVTEPSKSGLLVRQSMILFGVINVITNLFVGSVIKSWKKNYFVLTPGFLYIFVNQEV
jgi:hypothetical protein